MQRDSARFIDVEPHPASRVARIGKPFQHGRLSHAQIERDRGPIGSRGERKPRDRSSGNYLEKKFRMAAFLAFVFERKIVFVRSDRPASGRRMNIRTNCVRTVPRKAMRVVRWPARITSLPLSSRSAQGQISFGYSSESQRNRRQETTVRRFRSENLN